MSIKLRTYVASVFALFIIILTVFLGVTISEKSSGKVEEVVGDSLSGVAFQMSNKLDLFMWERYQEIHFLSKESSFLNKSNDLKYNSINQLKKDFPSFSWIGVTDAKGNVLTSTDHILEGKNIEARPVFQKGAIGPFIGDVHDAVLLSKLLPNPTGEPIQFVDISMPLKDDDGKFTWGTSRSFKLEMVGRGKEYDSASKKG